MLEIKFSECAAIFNLKVCIIFYSIIYIIVCRFYSISTTSVLHRFLIFYL